MRVYELDGVRSHERVGEAPDDLGYVVLELLGRFSVDVNAVDVVRSVDGAKEKLELSHLPIGCLQLVEYFCTLKGAGNELNDTSTLISNFLT